MSQLRHPVLQGDGRAEAEQLLGQRDVGEAVPDVSDAVLAGHLRLDVLLAQNLRELLADLFHRDAVAAADVEGDAINLGLLQREPAGGGDIGDAHEISPLVAVFEDQRRPVVQEPGREDREHTGVGVRERLAGPIDIEEPQSHGRDVIGGAEQEAEALLVELAQRVDRR